MKRFLFYLFFGLLIIFFLGCENEEMVSPDAVKLSVKFSWKGIVMCDHGNPEIHLANVPEQTEFIKIHMFDHVYNDDHGQGIVHYNKDNIIAKGQFKKIQGPCPTGAPGLYEITVKALDQNKVIIGTGSMERSYPE